MENPSKVRMHDAMQALRTENAELRSQIAAARNQMDRRRAVAEAAAAPCVGSRGVIAVDRDWFNKLREAVRALQSTENTDD